MTLQDLALLGEVIGAFGVIASLIYLAFEIRHNTQAMRRAATQDIIHSLNEMLRFFIESPELAGLYFTASERPEELTAEERFRFQSLLTLAFSNFELAIEYYRDGLLSDEGIEVYAQGLRPLFENPIVVEWWEEGARGMYSQDLCDLVSKQTVA
jgi:hypothetical protein